MKKKILKAAVLVFLAGGAASGVIHWYNHRFEQSTDNAYIHGDMTAIAPKISGYVHEVTVSNNAQVKAGDVLVRLDARDYQARLDQAEAAVQAAQAALLVIDRQLDAQQTVIAEARAGIDTWRAEKSRSERDLGRINALVRNDYASRQSLDTARADADKAEAGINQARAKLASAESQVAVIQANRVAQQAALAQAIAARELAQADLDHTVITAPIDGVIGNSAVRLGEYVGPGAQMMVVVPLTGLWVEANYKETQITHMQAGQPVRLVVDAYPDTPLTASVTSFAPASGAQFSLLPPENASGNFTKIVQRVPVRIALPDHGPLAGLLRPGLSVVVDIDTAPTPASGR